MNELVNSYIIGNFGYTPEFDQFSFNGIVLMFRRLRQYRPTNRTIQTHSIQKSVMQTESSTLLHGTNRKVHTHTDKHHRGNNRLIE